MSKTRCPYCCEVIEGTEDKCPHCGEMLIEQNVTNETKEVKPSTPVKQENLREQQTDEKPILIKIIHVVSLWACVILAFSGCGMLFAESLNIAEGAIYTSMWTGAIFFLLVWKFTE